MVNRKSEEFQEVAEQSEQGQNLSAEPTSPKPKQRNSPGWLEMLARLGLGETVARIGTGALTLTLVLMAVAMMRALFQATPHINNGSIAENSGPTATPPVKLASLPPFQANISGVARIALMHTNIPDRSRADIYKYTIAKGDTVIGIAEKFNLKPQSVMFGNVNTIRDDPHNLRIGAVLSILPVDGYYYEWQAGDGLNGVAKGLNVTPEAIINYPLNHLDLATIGNFSNPNIKPGTMLIVPGGTRPYNSWSAPTGVTRDRPVTARVAGDGACPAISDGAVGLGTFIWPANQHILSGFDYSPETNHRGIDIAGETGDPIYAVDAGVIVYSGWNPYGYGNMIMVDHGNEWQSLYAHLNSIGYGCGQSVDQGSVIGALGSTGNSSGSHLHFELMHTLYSKVNPWRFLP